MAQFFKILATAWRYRQLFMMLIPVIRQIIDAIDDDDDDKQKKKPAPVPIPVTPLATFEEIVKEYKRQEKLK